MSPIRPDARASGVGCGPGSDRADRAIVAEHEIDCAFELGRRLPARARWTRPPRTLTNHSAEDAALADELGFDAKFVEDVPFAAAPGVRFPDQARFHPRKYLAGAGESRARDRAARSSSTAALRNSSSARFASKPMVAGCAAEDVVIATHNPLVGIAERDASVDSLSDKAGALHQLRRRRDGCRRGTVPDALFWDTADPYHYLRIEPHRDHDMVIFGGEDHKTGQASDTQRVLERLEQRLVSTMVPDIEADATAGRARSSRRPTVCRTSAR